MNQNGVPKGSMNHSLNNHSAPVTDKIAYTIKKWNLHFDGSAQGLDVEEFLYRVKSLTADYFDDNYSLICKHLNILLTGKARYWFWRYRKQVPSIVWDDFCTAIRYQYIDFKSDADIRGELRNRKQRPGENFETFYDSVCVILNRLTTQIPETELIEIIKRNIRAEIRHELLYVPILNIKYPIFSQKHCRGRLFRRTNDGSYTRKFCID